MAKAAAKGSDAYTGSPLALKKLIAETQLVDDWAKEKREAINQSSKRRQGAGEEPWKTSDAGTILYKDRIWVPPESSLRAKLLGIFHDDPLAGHFGRDKTLELISREYYWQDMEEDVTSYINSCAECQGAKAIRQRPPGVLQALPQPQGPWQEITMDFVTGLPLCKRSDNVYDAIWVVVDRYTKMAKYIPTQVTITSSKLADLFIQEILRSYGLPKGIVSDRGSVFTSQF